MNNHALSNIIEQNLVTDENGWGEEIVYTRRSGETETTNSMVSEGELRKIKEDVESSTATFFSVSLASAPVIGETIEYNSKTWKVIDFSGKEIYDIVAETEVKYTGKKSGKTWQ